MSYLLAAYGITLIALVSYGLALSRERARLQAQNSPRGDESGS